MERLPVLRHDSRPMEQAVVECLLPEVVLLHPVPESRRRLQPREEVRPLVILVLFHKFILRIYYALVLCVQHCSISIGNGLLLAINNLKYVPIIISISQCNILIVLCYNYVTIRHNHYVFFFKIVFISSFNMAIKIFF